MFKKVSTQFHGRELSLESGKIAKQASGAVTLRYGDTVILVTVVAEKTPSEARDFALLTVNYQEKFYAAGKIPGGFFRRESVSTDIGVLACRLIDRPIRPLFPKHWFYETQIIPTVFSADGESNPAVLSLVGASAALELSPIPFDGPVAAVQLARINGDWIVNPSYAQSEESDLELVVAGNRQGITMVEGGAAMIPEDELLEAIFMGYDSLIPLLDLQDELRQAVGHPKREVEPLEASPELKAKMRELVGGELETAWRIPGKLDRHDRLREIWNGVFERLVEQGADLGPNNLFFSEMLAEIDKDVLRKMIIEEGVRADGRKLNQLRQVTCETGLLPRTHGSALFTRGETQSLAITTLGTRRDEKKIERLEDDYYKTFFLNYNFPPYSVAEVKMRLAPGRREIGHGHLAERALARVLPDHEDFPYTIRVVSEITESNGSSSMASVCGGSLSLMDAGVPVMGQVAGVAMGLVKESDDKFHVLTDIMGDEDHCGDMDFKVAGTAEGVTAVQMDIKISGVNREMMGRALAEAREARLKILEAMNQTLSAPRSDLSRFAPRIVTIQVPADKIRDVIGPGGKMIRAIVEETGAAIDVEDDGTVKISSTDAEANERAIKIINDLTAVAEIGMVYKGKVAKITDFGAFVTILPNTDGLLHISRIENFRINKVTDVLQEGDEVVVKVLDIDENGKISLSRKDVLDQQPEGARRPPPPQEDSGREERDDRMRPPPGSRPYRGDGPERGESDSRGDRRPPRHKARRPRGTDRHDSGDEH